MERDTEALSREIGNRVRQLRMRLGWPLTRLATESGVSRTMLQAIEQGNANPSIGVLLKLSNVLGAGLPELLEPEPPSVTAEVTRAGDGTVLWQGQYGGSGVIVARADPPEVMVLWEWTLEPGERHASDPHITGTRELLQVQAGTLWLEHDGSEHRLDAGDSMIFHGDAPHAYGNRGERATRFLLTVIEPTPTRKVLA